ncbi:4-hydroxy-tetrahydrodipicolinate reductase [Neoehrlichia mikurensis]|uniref:4-hydroxy-tetrahydrodipicolinate reductase n=1 Tax=Neoehrlichia mikurensis TaxID=89586 RepID=A0A9Q9F3M9_9RICK|nr:4-hydroxy-tetrahydrodipicolinate reductase [Neoehrlichia mikurensis]QXK91820.1 4-hydroxy-tetrahydrodipicolinate reductase [Neoehrlichia mikurensis]QXK93033.1 4-hydroxy-tetrahydrodipicolinate reductase [Neoehrlichia mikurensis]QXK93510.1 4-hydroxy-tetrahydrodipicolinate reductase [Neoehrlichia mikurensis]UTO55535.1 4-hydroxy-tetrahydrodipicolinate reductase [Neoehrlichia mikurensis]UTO56456.1 4-hydroxy-tetrahydrodipicolinate reductase [Neoehrlichia mikurensis]
MTVKVGVVGCLGRMGKAIIYELAKNGNVEISGGVVRAGSPYVGADMGKVTGCGYGINIIDSLEDIFDISDVVIEFTNRDNMIKCIEVAVRKKKPMVSGTTGIDDLDFNKYVSDIPFLWSGNMSVGVNLLIKLIAQAADALKGYDIEIWELHHKGKKDAPSGTALMMGRAAAKGLKTDFKMKQYVNGYTENRIDDSIGFAVSRGGSAIGDHSIMFIGDGELVELKHRSMSRNIFSEGAVKAALWIVNQPVGIYSMLDVL